MSSESRAATDDITVVLADDHAVVRKGLRLPGQLYLSVRTVESHRAHIQQKTRLSSRAELVRYALEHQLIDVPA
jgi:two-component system response regulator NreC